MKIANSTITLSSMRRYAEYETRKESLRAWIGNQRPIFDAPSQPGAPAPRALPSAGDAIPGGMEVNSGFRPLPPSPSPNFGRGGQGVRAEGLMASTGYAGTTTLQGDKPQATALAKQMIDEVVPRWPTRGVRIDGSKNPSTGNIIRTLAKKASAAGMEDEGTGLTPELRIVKLLLERLFGIKIKLTSLPNAGPDAEGQSDKNADPTPSSERRQGWGLEYELHETYYESEVTSFSASGLVRTTDGKEIRFSLDLRMSREFVQENRVSLRAGDAVDPLVINFDGTAAQLSQTRFAFDLDADGTAEEISSTGSGSGFLALDLNNDGKINNGSELFGPRTGDGFAELSQYDQDRNRWIDENDAVYDRLRIWQGGDEGGGALAALRQRDVGAIYLGREKTPFAIKDTQNDLQGQVVASGVYLSEDGSAGSVQQVNLVV